MDHLELVGLAPIGITITGGQQVQVDPLDQTRFRVPKRDLISSLVMASQQRRIQIAKGLPLHPIIQQELLAFEMRFTANGSDTYEGRQGTHDDLVLSLAMATWLAEQVVNAAAAQHEDQIAQSEFEARHGTAVSISRL